MHPHLPLGNFETGARPSNHLTAEIAEMQQNHRSLKSNEILGALPANLNLFKELLTCTVVLTFPCTHGQSKVGNDGADKQTLKAVNSFYNAHRGYAGDN